jgi:hypothetical protein
MKKALKIIGGILLFLILSFTTVFFIYNEKKPEIIESAEADKLAHLVESALNKSSWDSTNVLRWTFKNIHSYVWDKRNNLVSVKWDDTEVLLNLTNWEKGKAFKNGLEIKDKNLDILRGKAYSYFCNDSFWLIAPFKFFDAGVRRSIVITKENQKALLISYSSGGVTPGDSYLWVLSEYNRPQNCNMWVKIIPIGGVKATWEKWTTTKTGVVVSLSHKLGPITIEISNLEMGYILKDINIEPDYFKNIAD